MSVEKISDRELDQMVAENFMDYPGEVVWIATSDEGKSTCFTSESRQEVLDFLRERHERGYLLDNKLGKWIKFPRYTTDPTACQRLKDKMRGDGWNYSVRWRGDQINPLTGFYACEFWRGTDQGTWAREITELRAVVIAALRAKGVVVPT